MIAFHQHSTCSSEVKGHVNSVLVAHYPISCSLRRRSLATASRTRHQGTPSVSPWALVESLGEKKAEYTKTGFPELGEISRRNKLRIYHLDTFVRRKLERKNIPYIWYHFLDCSLHSIMYYLFLISNRNINLSRSIMLT